MTVVVYQIQEKTSVGLASSGTKYEQELEADRCYEDTRGVLVCMRGNDTVAMFDSGVWLYWYTK